METHHKSRHSGTWTPIILVGTALFFLCLLSAVSGPPGEQFLRIPPVFGNDAVFIPAGRFILIFSAVWILCLAMLLVFPKGISESKIAAVIVVLGIACRLALLPHPPSDDIYRYLWEGRLLCEGISPYQYAPDDPILVELAKTDPFHGRINHPYSPAVYPPFVLYIFSFAFRIAYHPMTLKLLIVLCDMGAVWFILGLLRHHSLNPRWSVLYAFNPVILFGYAGHGHLDAIQIFFLTGALWFHCKKRWVWMFLFVGLAVQSKYVAALTIPFFINKKNVRYGWIAVVATIAPYLPVVDSNWRMVLIPLVRFGENYAFNGSIHGLMRVLLDGIGPATAVCKIMLCCALVFGLWRFHPARCGPYRNDPISGCFFAMGALLLLAPTVHFWYLGWIIPFVALRPTQSWVLLCLTVAGWFAASGIQHYTGEFRIPKWVVVLEWLPFYALFFFDIRRFVSRTTTPIDAKPPKSVSVVIPAKNEAGNIGPCIQAIMRDKTVCEVIVVDGGSTDGTVQKAELTGARVLIHHLPPEKGGGRGGQIHAGLSVAKGDIVAIVHADTRVTSPTFRFMRDVLSKNPGIVGGAVGGIFDSPGLRFRLLELLNDFRMVVLGISFGDQVQFFRRVPIMKLDIFPNIPLMEDVELSLRLHQAGRQTYLFEGAIVSARRWKKAGFVNSLSVIRMVASYLLKRVSGEPDITAMYRMYYGNRGKWKKY